MLMGNYFFRFFVGIGEPISWLDEPPFCPDIFDWFCFGFFCFAFLFAMALAPEPRKSDGNLVPTGLRRKTASHLGKRTGIDHTRRELAGSKLLGKEPAMRNIAILLLLFIAVVSLGLAASAEGLITVDPNTPGAREAEEKPEPDGDIDARLDQKISYEARRLTASTVVADLAEKTGITLKAGQNNKDWQSRDTKMVIFAKDVPLKDLMTSMARATKFKWSREKVDDQFVYRFYMPRRTQTEADERVQREAEEKERKQAQKRLSAIEAYTNTANLSPQDMEKLKKDNPFLYAVAKAGVASPLGQFLTACPSAEEALATGSKADLSASTLSAAGQQGMLHAMQAMWKMENTMGRMDRPFPDEMANNIGQASIRINSHMDDIRGMPGMDMMLGAIEFRCGERRMDIPLIDPQSDFAKIIGKALVKSQDEGVSMEDAMRESQSEIMKAMTAGLKADAGEELTEHPDEPDLHKKITFSPKYDEFTGEMLAVQAALAKQAEVTVVADSYGAFELPTREFPGITQLPTGEVELKDLLDKIADKFGWNWEKHGSAIEFRDRKWYEKRAAMIPEEWLEAWRTTLEETGTLDIGDLAHIASLTQEQTMANIMPDETLRRCGIPWSFYSARDALRLYATLDQSQQSALFSETGLDLKLLTAEQWMMAEKLITSRNASILTNPDARLVITGTRKPVEKIFEYTFSIPTDDESGSIKWSFTTPGYQPAPPKPEPKPEATMEEDEKSPAAVEDEKGPEDEEEPEGETEY